MSDLGASLIRTVVPLIVGVVVAAALRVGVSVDEATVTPIATAVVTAIYYALVRVLETHVSPKFGWLLGLARQPAYAKPADQ